MFVKSVFCQFENVIKLSIQVSYIIFIFYWYFKSMANGQRGHTGTHAQSRARAEVDLELGCVAIPHLQMAD